MIKNLISKNEKECIDEQCKSMHFFRNKSLKRLYFTSMFNKEEYKINFNNKNYLCRVIWVYPEYKIDEDSDKMIEIELEIIKEID